MAVVAQFNNMNFETTVRDVVMLGRTPHLGFMEREREQDFEIVDDALRRVGMYEIGTGAISPSAAARNSGWCWPAPSHSSRNCCC